MSDSNTSFLNAFAQRSWEMLPMAAIALTCTVALVQPAMGAEGLYVSGKWLKDANNNNFVMRGVNNPHAWFDSQSYNALPRLSALGCNTIRVVWSKNKTSSADINRLDQILWGIEAQRMNAMIELHDGTGSNDTNLLNQMSGYFANNINWVIKNHKKHVMINIANEWGDSNISDYSWKEAYKWPITQIRNSGLNVPIVLDGPGWGQRASQGLTYGQELVNHDPKHSLIFSTHMYGAWNNTQSIIDTMWNYNQKNLCFIIGEFGYNYNNGNNNLGCKVDHITLMKYAQWWNIGYLAWSTCGNDSANAWLNLTNDWYNPTWPWGNQVFWYAEGGTGYGISQTSRRDTSF